MAAEHRKRANLAASGLICLLLAACLAEQYQEQTEWSSPWSSVAVETTVVALDQAQWFSLWELAGAAPPRILPEGFSAVGIFLGSRPFGGFSVAILSTQQEPDALVVTYEEVAPEQGAFVFMALTNPYLIRLIPRTDLPIVFRKSASPIR